MRILTAVLLCVIAACAADDYGETSQAMSDSEISTRNQITCERVPERHHRLTMLQCEPHEQPCSRGTRCGDRAIGPLPLGVVSCNGINHLKPKGGSVGGVFKSNCFHPQATILPDSDPIDWGWECDSICGYRPEDGPRDSEVNTISCIPHEIDRNTVVGICGWSPTI